MYTSVDSAARQIVSLGRGTHLAKLDLESAYRMLPIHPDDRPLLGMKWRDWVWIDTTLPFGLRSAPKIFNVMADCLQWILENKGSCKVIHYLDDFLFMGEPGSQQCGESLQLALNTCQRLGVRVSMEKLEGPSTQISFLGIMLDTERLEVRLPEEKMARLAEAIAEWRGNRSCTKRELLSLLGILHHACKVVQPGQSFLRRMIELSKVVTELHHHIRLNTDFRSDLEWWAMFLPEWNGVGMLSSLGVHSHTVTMTSDASGSWGCGAFSDRDEWFQLPWPEEWLPIHITVKELLPIVLASAMWGQQWIGESVLAFTDNAAVVAIINSGCSKDPQAMHLMRCLFFFLAQYKCTLRATHIQGCRNIAADALSRNNLNVFRQQVPIAKRLPSPLQPELVKLLVTTRPDWMSTEWKRLFASILRKD